MVESVPVKCTINGAMRMIIHAEKWDAWWPGTKDSNPATFYFNEQKFQPETNIVQGTNIRVEVSAENFNDKTLLMLLPASQDSVFVQWQGNAMSLSNNPLKRIAQWRQARQIKKNLRSILNSLKSFLQNEKNIYGMNVNKVKVKDSILITTKFTTSSYPTTPEVYSAIEKLKKYLAEQQATENNFPMLHVGQRENGNCDVQVAIPVNKELPAVDGMVTKRMQLGNILEAEITGGPSTVQQELNELENYKQDYSLISPAIPFQLLVTDRQKQIDTSKWITRIYYPIF